MGSRVRVSSGPPTKESKKASITSKPLLFLCFSTCKKYDYLLLVVSEGRLTIDNLSPFTVNYAKSPNDFMPNHRIFKLLLTFADVNTLKSSICTYNATLPIVYWLRLFFFISQKPFRLPFLRSIMPFSVRLIVMVLTVLSDLPMCVAISFCVAFGRSCKKFSTVISSKVQFKVQILHFEV